MLFVVEPLSTTQRKDVPERFLAIILEKRRESQDSTLRESADGNLARIN